MIFQECYSVRLAVERAVSYLVPSRAAATSFDSATIQHQPGRRRYGETQSGAARLPLPGPAPLRHPPAIWTNCAGRRRAWSPSTIVSTGQATPATTWRSPATYW
jgi:hypothetical protein